MSDSDGAIGLARLETRLREDLTLLELPGKSWVPTRTRNGERVRDVVVIGAGMCGLAAAARFQLGGIDNIAVFDRSEEGTEGPWNSFARMETLRSPKTLAGPALGLPALTFRAWYTAQYGQTDWEALDKIPRPMWMEYLIWYRKVMQVPVENGVTLTAISDAGDELIQLELIADNTARQVFTRHLVLATGRSGLGGTVVPEMISALPEEYWAHSADDIDFAALEGKRVAVIGAGASAMDNAATALEAGAASVDMLIRRPELPRINKMTGIGSQGVVHGMRALSDTWRYRFFEYTNRMQTPPPHNSTLRVSRHKNARFFLGCPIQEAQTVPGGILLHTPVRDFEVDYVIAATGFRNDFSGRGEFASIAPHIRTWDDGIWHPSMGRRSEFLTSAPYLGSRFEFLEKDPGTCPMLARIHCFNDAAMLSHGKLSGDIPAVSAGADRLFRGIAQALFAADADAHFETLQAFDRPELTGDEWTDSSPLFRERPAAE